LLVAAAPAGSARILTVPGEQATLADALARAGAGDTVLVAAGRYAGGFLVPDGVSLIAVSGPDSTVIDGNGRGPVVTFDGVGPQTLLEGFTVTGGVLTDERGDGAGVRCIRHASPRLNALTITGNRALGEDGRGGGVACLDGASPIIANSLIENNEAMDGGGIYAGKRRGNFESSPVVSGNRVLGNRARRRGGGMSITHSSEAVVAHNVVARNTALEGGGGLAVERALPRITGNLIWANEDSSARAGGMLLREYASPVVERNILLDNRSGPAVRCDQRFQERHVFRCNVLWANAGGGFSPECGAEAGNLNVDPELCDPQAGRFALSPSSPCQDAMGCGRIGPFGVGCGEGEASGGGTR
jgi:hypothetical protein